MLPWQPFVFSVLHHFWDEKQRNLNYFQANYLIKLKFGRERAIFRSSIQVNKNFHVWFHFDVTMTKRQNTHISEIEKVYGVIF